jgi:hypothetical protein
MKTRLIFVGLLAVAAVLQLAGCASVGTKTSFVDGLMDNLDVVADGECFVNNNGRVARFPCRAAVDRRTMDRYVLLYDPFTMKLLTINQVFPDGRQTVVWHRAQEKQKPTCNGCPTT